MVEMAVAASLERNIIVFAFRRRDAAERERERTILKREREREREATWQNQEGKDAKREGKKEGGGGG